MTEFNQEEQNTKTEETTNEPKQNDDRLADALKDLASQFKKTADVIGEQFSAAAKNIDEHVKSEEFQQKTDNVKKATADVVEKVVNGAAKGTVLVSEGFNLITDAVAKGLKKTVDSVQEAFKEEKQDPEQMEEQQENKTETVSEQEAYAVDIEWKNDKSEDEPKK